MVTAWLVLVWSVLTFAQSGFQGLAGGTFESFAESVSGDGLVVVGSSHTDSGYQAFIRDTQNGMRNLRSVLVDVFGLDLTD